MLQENSLSTKTNQKNKSEVGQIVENVYLSVVMMNDYFVDVF